MIMEAVLKHMNIQKLRDRIKVKRMKKEQNNKKRNRNLKKRLDLNHTQLFQWLVILFITLQMG
jgi:ribosomal protein L4